MLEAGLFSACVRADIPSLNGGYILYKALLS